MTPYCSSGVIQVSGSGVGSPVCLETEMLTLIKHEIRKERDAAACVYVFPKSYLRERPTAVCKLV